MHWFLCNLEGPSSSARAPCLKHYIANQQVVGSNPADRCVCCGICFININKQKILISVDLVGMQKESTIMLVVSGFDTHYA